MLAGDSLTEERAGLFALLGFSLGGAPSAAFLDRLAGLAAVEGRLGAALATLAEAAAATTQAAAAEEHFALFIGVGRGELQPYASFYRTGFLHDRPLADLRADLARLGIARAAGTLEPEDHIAFLCETMAGLLGGRLGPGASAADAFFTRHLAPWAGRFFTDLTTAEAARFYRAIGGLGRIAIELELAAAALPA